MTGLTRRDLLTAAALLAAAPASAGDAYTPGRGDPDRKGILDAIRPRIEAEMRGPVEFVVSALKVQDGWAFAVLEPQRPGGARIDLRATGYADAAGYMDGITVYALARYARGRWNLIDSVTGPTDVAFADWPRFYGAPRAIFGF